MQATERPRFRQDLVAEPIDDGGSKFIDVMDPDSGNVFRFYEVEYSLACAMDGERDVAGIVQWAREELGLTPSSNEVKTVIATLGDLGYLDGHASARAVAPPRVAAEPVPSDAFEHESPTVVTEEPVPAAARRGYDDLAPGVVVGATPSRSAPPAADVELGFAGSSAPRAADVPRGPELELGAPGARAPMPRDRGRVEDIPLGASGRMSEPEIDRSSAPTPSDVSLDLSDHLSVRPDDVKEAVRASQVMKAVDVPKELLDSVEPVLDQTKSPPSRAASPAIRPEPIQAAQPKPARPATPARGVDQPVAVGRSKVATNPPPNVAKPGAVPMAPTPNVASAPIPVAPQAKRTSPVLIGLLIVCVIGLAAYLAYKYVLTKPEATTSEVTPAPTPAPTPPAPTPPAPPAEAVKLSVLTAEPQAIKPGTAGQVEMVVADGSDVKAQDVVVWLAGYKPINTEATALEGDIEKRVKVELAKAQQDREAAVAAGDKAKQAEAEGRIANRQKSLDEKIAKLTAKKADLDKLLVRAPIAGKIAVVVKTGAKISPNDVVARITKAPMLVATFKAIPKSVELGAGTKVELQDGDNKIACAVEAVDDAGAKIVCPTEASAEGKSVTFGKVLPSDAAPAVSDDKGSATAPVDDKGSAAPPDANGSAAATKAVVPAPAKAPTPAPAKAPTPAKAPAPAPAKAPAPAPAPEAPAPDPAAAGSAQ